MGSHETMQKKVSVCVPACNAAQFIGETIQSVLGSVYRDVELIISDDASTDGTAGIVESFRDHRIRLYRNERNEGAVRNWNRAVARATGEYVSLLNHDDLYSPFWLTFAVHHLEKNPHVGWVATAFLIIDATGKILGMASRFRATGEIPREEAFLETAKLNGLGPGFVVRREALEAVGYYDEDAGPGADNDLYLRLAAKYPLFYCAAFPYTMWRRHEHNLTLRWGWLEQTREGVRILEKIFNDPFLPPELARHRDDIFQRFADKGKLHDERFLRQGDEKTYREVRSILKSEERGYSPAFSKE